ncbi:DNA repair protein [Schizophyllum commune Loenen D]|nr:DNA repair protein [Schizophyllum commune Loenen D]
MSPSPKTLQPDGTQSSDYFEDDSVFLEALRTAVLPGDPGYYEAPKAPSSATPATANPLKRPRTDSEPEDSQVVTHDNDDTYAPSKFDGFGDYMRRKRAKLQIQNAEFDSEAPKIFKDLAIYINGWTQPSVQDLRKLIVQHGGVFQPYLDKKAIVTHIITNSLTPAKIAEFKHMKVVRPEWLVDSAKAGTVLPWRDYMYVPHQRPEQSQGAAIAQRTLHNGFASTRPKSTPKPSPTEAPAVPAVFADPPPSEQPEAGPSDPDADKYKPESTDPVKPRVIDDAPAYARWSSNLHAQRAMADPEWRKAHTSAAFDFIDGYYKNSRLHHLSTWKAELKRLVQEAQARAEDLADADGEREGDAAAARMEGDAASKKVSGDEDGADPLQYSMRAAGFVLRSPSKKGKGKAREVPVDRVIMHCDFDSFFVAAGLIGRPELRGKPVVVCHSQDGGNSSTSEIASASYEARKFGIKNGMSLQQARTLCPTVRTIPYEFERYKEFSLKFYTILMSHADDLQAVSVDEALIDVSSTVHQLRSDALPGSDPAKDLAESIRSQVRSATGCEVSIGIAHNILLARLATRRAKPAGSHHVFPEDVPELMSELEIADLHGFGWSARKKVQEKLGSSRLSDLARKSKGLLIDTLGRSTGETLYNAIRGIDERRLESDKKRKSVSAEINYGIRLENDEEARTFIFRLAREVSRRLEQEGVIGRSITLKIMKRDPTAPVEPSKFLGHGPCDVFNKQAALAGRNGRATSDAEVIGEHAWRILESLHFDAKELRGIGIQIQKLQSLNETDNAEPGQSRLNFATVEGSDKVDRVVDKEPIDQEVPNEGTAGPSKKPESASATLLDLPRFSQVDKNVLQALPTQIRDELTGEYKRRSASPAVLAPEPPQLERPRARTPDSLFSKRPNGKVTNFARITHQLAPRTTRPSVSPRKSIFAPGRGGPGKVSAAELEKLEIDPTIFALLPPKVQREQLLRARLAKSGTEIDNLPEPPRKVLKPRRRATRSASTQVYAPPPQAHLLEPASLKHQIKGRSDKLIFTDVDEVQGLLERWVVGYRHWPPKEKDAELFRKYLLQCLDSTVVGDEGLETAVAVMKWWLVLLRRQWEHCERHEDDDGLETAKCKAGRAWWAVFRSVKGEMDQAARKRFGGSLSLR